MADTWLHRWLDTPRGRVMPRVAIWQGTLRLPKGAALALEGFDAPLARGERFFDVRVEDGELRVLGWDWREDYERRHEALEVVLTAAAKLGAKGSVTCLSQLGRVIRDRKSATWGAERWVKWSAKNGALEIDEGDESTDKKVLAALGAIFPALDAWLTAHPDARERMEHREQYGYLDRTGRVVVAPTLSAASEMTDGLASIARDGVRQVIDVDGRVVLESAISVGHYLRGRMPIQTEQGMQPRWGYADRTGALVIAADYLDAKAFHGPLAVVSTGTWIAQVHRWITPDGALVGEPFDHTHGFTEERAWVYANAERAFRAVDATGAYAFDARFANVAAYEGGLAAAAPVGSAMWGYVDREGVFAISPRFTLAGPFSEDRAVVQEGKETFLIDRAGARVGPTFDAAMAKVSEGLIAVRRRARVGFLDRDGAWAIEPRFHEAYAFHEGLAYVAMEIDGEIRWGHADRTGALALPAIYEWTNRFEDGLAPAKQDGLFGFIDRTGTWVIPPRYKTIQPRFTSDRVWAQLP